MVRRPAGEASRLEKGLRRLAPRDDGETALGLLLHAVRYAEHAPTELRHLVELADSSVAAVEDRANWLWGVVTAEIFALGAEQPRGSILREAVRAAYGLSPGTSSLPSIAKRLNHVMDKGELGAGCTEVRARQHWGEGVFRLAHRVEAALRDRPPAPPVGRRRWTWDDLPIEPDLPPWIQPIFIEAMTATYRLRGRTVISAVTERSVVALENDVETYTVTAYTPDGSGDVAQVSPLLNCAVGPLSSLPHGQGGKVQEVPMLLPRSLSRGERCFFSSEVTSHSNESPLVETQVTCRGIAERGLTMRIQFDEQPQAAWWYADVPDQHRLIPPEDDEHRLSWTEYGYLEHTFAMQCQPRVKYGIGWSWA